MGTLIECRGLSKSFGNKTALDNINLQLTSGRITALLGPNGSGKTTLIKMMNGLLVPTKGVITFCGKPIGAESKKHISYLPDQSYLNMNRKVKDMIAMFRDFYEDFEQDRAMQMLETLKISEQEQLKTLSKGTKEKVQLLLVMSRKAKLYILDEPIAGVDPAAREFILNTVITNYEQDASILISTHLISDIENILDDVVFIKDGQIMHHLLVEDIRVQKKKSVDAYFREVFKC